MGAILKFAVTATVAGPELATVGTILIVVGVIGLLVSMLWAAQAGRAGGVVERERVVEREPYADPYV